MRRASRKQRLRDQQSICETPRSLGMTVMDRHLPIVGPMQGAALSAHKIWDTTARVPPGH
jgi:hypothetical protein